MSRSTRIQTPTIKFEQENTLVVVLELSGKSWLVGALVPGLSKLSRYSLTPSAAELSGLLGKLTERVASQGRVVTRVVLAYEAGWDGFWLARHLQEQGVEVYVIQPASVLVDRRARRAKTDILDTEMLMRTLLAWLRGESGVCSMVPIPTEAEEDGRRPTRERQDLVVERRALVNRIDGLLASLGITGYSPLRRDRRKRLDELRLPGGGVLPTNAKARIARILDRLELVVAQISALEEVRDAVVTKDSAADSVEVMIRSLAQIKGIGPELATLLVWEAYVRTFPNRKALGSYAGITGTPFKSGGMDREQGISKAGNRRLRAALVELAWLWLRYQPGSDLSKWFYSRVGDGKGRMRKVMIVALARKLLVALWRFCREGVIPGGVTFKAA